MVPARTNAAPRATPRATTAKPLVPPMPVPASVSLLLLPPLPPGAVYGAPSSNGGVGATSSDVCGRGAMAAASAASTEREGSRACGVATSAAVVVTAEAAGVETAGVEALVGGKCAAVFRRGRRNADATEKVAVPEAVL